MCDLTEDNSSLTLSFGIWSAVAILYRPCLPCEVHIYIKCNMTAWIRPSWWRIFSLLQYFKATNTWYISFAMESCHSIYLFLASNHLALSIYIGTSIPNLWVLLVTLELMAEIIIYLFLRVNGTHDENAGSSKMPFATKNSATSTGLDSFRILIVVQVTVSSFHWMSNFCRVVFFLIFLTPLFFVMKASSLDTADSSFF